MTKGNPNPSIETRFKKGEIHNPGGRPKGGLKDYDRKKFVAMSEEEKETFLKKVPPEMRYRMAEGNPHQSSDVEVKVPQSLIELLNQDKENTP